MGQILRVGGIILMLIAAVSAFVWRAKHDSDYYKISATIGITGLIALLVGIWFAEHTLFAFLFGTGWF